MNDVLTIMLKELVAAQPADEYEFMPWMESVGQLILAHGDAERRGFCMLWVANEICLATRVPLIECCKVVVRAVEARKGVRT